MRLILQNGYPFPYPTNLSQDEQDKLADAAAGNTLEFNDILAFEWKHTVTVEFINQEAFEIGQQLTGWTTWSECVLEAPTSAADGYGHPAIIANGMAYCGFILREE
jgi:hypothetical protein